MRSNTPLHTLDIEKVSSEEEIRSELERRERERGKQRFFKKTFRAFLRSSDIIPLPFHESAVTHSIISLPFPGDDRRNSAATAFDAMR